MRSYPECQSFFSFLRFSKTIPGDIVSNWKKEKETELSLGLVGPTTKIFHGYLFVRDLSRILRGNCRFASGPFTRIFEVRTIEVEIHETRLHFSGVSINCDNTDERNGSLNLVYYVAFPGTSLKSRHLKIHEETSERE